VTTALEHAVAALNHEYLTIHPNEAAHELAAAKRGEIAAMLETIPIQAAIKLWQALPFDVQEETLPLLQDSQTRQLLSRSEPQLSARLLSRLSQDRRDYCLALLESSKSHELNQLMLYPDDSAGALMDPRFLSLKGQRTVRDSLQRIRRQKPKFTRQLFITDEQDLLVNMVEIQELALAEGASLLETLAKPVPAVVAVSASRDEVVETLEKYKMTDLPVVDIDGRLIGVIRHHVLLATMREEVTADMQTMVGASKDERALSSVGFVVRKRLPWLQINLLTAFLAAAVVGMFESTIAQFTALAVLLPVVAGQSGNTGAQALAVTMRGLALREIGTSHWRRVARKEIGAAFINGIAVALTTALGVFVWSGSYGLALVITISMVIAMVAAAFSGVVIPIVLRSLGQDPAQSSSIILTTVTDVAGFFSFLGIATLLMNML